MLIEAPEPHRCEKPPVSTHSRDLTLGSLFGCEECGTRWIVVPGDWGTYWTRLRWYHRTTVELEEFPGEREELERDRRAYAALLGLALVLGLVIGVLIQGWR